MIIDPENLEHEDAAAMLAMTLHRFLKENEGMVVHYKGTAFVVSKEKAEDDGQLIVGIKHDPELLKFEHGQMLWLEDEQCGNA